MKRGRRTKGQDATAEGGNDNHNNKVLMTFQIEADERDTAVDMPINVSEYLRDCVYRLNRSEALQRALREIQESALKVQLNQLRQPPTAETFKAVDFVETSSTELPDHLKESDNEPTATNV